MAVMDTAEVGLTGLLVADEVRTIENGFHRCDIDCLVASRFCHERQHVPR